jgi:hypothetical protein
MRRLQRTVICRFCRPPWLGGRAVDWGRRSIKSIVIDEGMCQFAGVHSQCPVLTRPWAYTVTRFSFP